VVPAHVSVETRGLQPLDLFARGARLVVHVVAGRHDVGGIVGCDEVAEHESSARRQARPDRTEQVLLLASVEMMDRKHRYRHVERTVRKLVLQSRESELCRRRERGACNREHALGLVDTDELGILVHHRDPAQRLAGARTEVEDPGRRSFTGSLGDERLQRLVRRDVDTNGLVVRSGVEVALLVAHDRSVCALRA